MDGHSGIHLAHHSCHSCPWSRWAKKERLRQVFLTSWCNGGEKPLKEIYRASAGSAAVTELNRHLLPPLRSPTSFMSPMACLEGLLLHRPTISLVIACHLSCERHIASTNWTAGSACTVEAKRSTWKTWIWLAFAFPDQNLTQELLVCRMFCLNPPCTEDCIKSQGASFAIQGAPRWSPPLSQLPNSWKWQDPGHKLWMDPLEWIFLVW